MKRWSIAALLCAATLLNYADRLTLSVVSVDVRREFHLTAQDYSHIVTLFMLAYAIMYAGSGYIVDRLGTRRGYAFFVAAWSAAQMLHAAALGKWTLGGWRFALGLTEPGNWPAAAKAVAEWFPPQQRALGIGIFSAGSSIGSALAPPVVAWITLQYGWRSAFLATGSLGLVWLVLWLAIYRPPANAAQSAPAATVDWRAIIRKRGCWTLILTRFFTDPVIYFVIFWLPEYLRAERNFDLAMVGRYAWVPFAFNGVAYLTGGWLSGRLMRAGWPLPRARKAVMLMGAAIMPAAILAPRVPEAWMAIGAISLMGVGHALWVSNLQALPLDLFPGNEIGTATGFSGMGGAVGGMIANLGTGWLVANFSYTPVFLLAGLMHPLSAALTYWLLPDRLFALTPSPQPQTR
jgi:ACS family hexuronate transporter-like MFS transporter